MGMEQVVNFAPGRRLPGRPLRDLLSQHGFPVQLRMIDGELAFPDEQPPEGWTDLRVGTPQGMVTLRRQPDRMQVVTWGNADQALRQAWNGADVGRRRGDGRAGRGRRRFRDGCRVPRDRGLAGGVWQVVVWAGGLAGRRAVEPGDTVISSSCPSRGNPAAAAANPRAPPHGPHLVAQPVAPAACAGRSGCASPLRSSSNRPVSVLTWTRPSTGSCLRLGEEAVVGHAGDDRLQLHAEALAQVGRAA